MILGPKRTSAWPRLARSGKDGSDLYMACENCDFVWTEKQLQEFRLQWASGVSIQQMARYFDRDADEVIILAIDQAQHEEIHPRPGGILGALGA